jgi:hypothetical protein
LEPHVLVTVSLYAEPCWTGEVLALLEGVRVLVEDLVEEAVLLGVLVIDEDGVRVIVIDEDGVRVGVGVHEGTLSQSTVPGGQRL